MSPHYGTIKKVIEYIDENIEKKILLNDVAAHTNLSPITFTKYSEPMELRLMSLLQSST
jgi:transcriptional regulator GlxA family with amidase domain